MLLAVQGFLRLLPLGWVFLPGQGLGWAMFSLFRFRRRATLRNLEIAFGDAYSVAERRQLAARTYRFFGGVICEMLAMPRLSAEDLAQAVTLENPEVLQNALEEGHGAILVSGHLGNWEFMGAALSRAGMVLSMYVGAQKNPLVDGALNRIRQSHGTRTVGRGVAMRGLLRALREGRVVAMLADQHYSRKQHYVDFFGEPVSMVPGPASISMRVGAPLIFGECIRVGRFRYRVRFTAITRTQPSGDDERDLLALSQTISSTLETAIRAHPDQYFWMHRRWRPIPERVTLSETNKSFLAEQKTLRQREAAGTSTSPV